VIDYLQQTRDESLLVDASGYLQHLTYNNDLIKEECRQYNAIPALVNLLNTSSSPEVLRNACGCLKNLAFGRANDPNKRLIHEAGGVRALAKVLQRAAERSPALVEEASGALWNLSSADELKEVVLKQAAEAVVSCVVVPWSGLRPPQVALAAAQGQQPPHPSASNIYRNGSGILRNVSGTSANARKTLRAAPNLVDALVYALASALQRNQLDTRGVENTVCLLRNLSYRQVTTEIENAGPSVPLSPGRPSHA